MACPLLLALPRRNFLIGRSQGLCLNGRMKLGNFSWSKGPTILILLAIFSASRAKNANPGAAPTATWIFLNVGAQRARVKSMPQEEVKKLQTTHVNNFGDQFELGRLMTAGPLGDNGTTRGTVVLSVTQPDQIVECFKPDPFIQNEILAVEAHPWLVDVMKFCPASVPFKMTQHTLCVVKKGQIWKPGDMPKGADAMVRLFPEVHSEELAISGPFLDAGDKLGILLFYSTNQAQIKAQLSATPRVALGQVELEFHPQYLGVGTFRKAADNAPPKSGQRIRLFDGKSFTGWDGDSQHTWRIKGGALTAGGGGESVPYGDVLCSSKEYKNFDLRLRVRLTGSDTCRAGVQFRSQRPKVASGMTGYRADMGEGFWGGIYDESRRNQTLAHSHAAVLQHLVKAGDWNEYVIRCEDRHIRLWLNGVLTADYTEEDAALPQSGFIGLAIHGGTKAEVAYRDITIEELPAMN
jgi:uncharacterized protein YciI